MRIPLSYRSATTFFRPLLLIISLVLVPAIPSIAQKSIRETVIEDTPGRLILEVEGGVPQAREVADGQRVVMPGFLQATTPGAPDLPWYTFQVAAGARTPLVSVDPLEWVDVEVPKGLAGVRRPITSREDAPAHDAALFAAAQGISPQLSGSQLYRGMALRNISLIAATFSEGSGNVRVMRKFRVTVTFPNPAATPAFGVKTWLQQADVKNVNGGQYLVSLPKAPLRRTAAANLASGSFLKIKVGDRVVDGFDEDGVYALTYEAAKAAGLPSGKAVGTLRMYAGPQGGAQGPLGIAMDSLVAPTLKEIPIRIAEGSTGQNPNRTFDEGDTILFYGHGTSLWKPIPGATGPVRWEFSNDPYSFENYYYLDWQGADNGSALRLDTLPFVPAATTVTSAPHYLRAKKELGTGSCDLSSYFDGETGYVWYWYWKGSCSDQSPGLPGLAPTLNAAQLRSASAENLPGLVSDSTVWFGTFTFPLSNGSTGTLWSRGVALPAVSLGINGTWSSRSPGLVGGDSLGIDSLQWTNASRVFEGYTVRYIRRLAWTGKPRRIFPVVTGQRVGYHIDGVQVPLRVWRVEKDVAGKLLQTQNTATSVEFSDIAGTDEDVSYFVSQGSNPVAGSALSMESVPATAGVTQNLVTGDGYNPEYIIIAPQALLPEAVVLRNYRLNDTRSTRYTTTVVRTEDIYREWSGGRLSPVAIRDFLRWALNRWGNGSSQGNLKYVVLYGDGHYDYRNIRNGGSNNFLPNHIPPFNWDDGQNFNPMSTDDFYAVLDSGERWDGTAGLDISLGRLPFQNLDQARSYQDKITLYENPATAGEWRSRILLAGDDDKQREKGDGGFRHTAQAETLGNYILANDPGMRKEQVYLFDYPVNASFLKPEATQDLINDYNGGVLLSTFFGHGAYNQMADEVLLKTNDGMARFQNLDRFFMMTIFSCTVGRFDKLADEGMSEQFLRMPRLGSIGALSASRESTTGENALLGYAFAAKLFDSYADSIARGMGDATRLAKNQIGPQGNLNSQKYVLQGEPVTVINRPGLGVTLDTVASTLQALGCDTVRGHVAFGSGKGRVNLRVISGDVPKTYNSIYQGAQSVLKPGQTLFERTVDYDSSRFSIGYFLPKSVPFGDTAAKLQIFAWDANELRESAVLVANRRISGDIGNCVVDEDGLGPRISVTGCNTKETGGIDFPDKVKISLPYCLQITVRDTVGGVLSGDGPDEGTTVEVVGAVAPFHPQPGVDDLYAKSYQVTLSNQDLDAGTHLLKITARDGFGNVGARQISLEVSQDTVLRFTRAFNVPNPMKRNGTTFYFQTSLPSEEGGALTSPRVDRINFHVRIFNQSGYMVQEFRDAVSGQTHWDGKDAWGRQLANGVYFYQVTASWDESNGSPQGGRQVSKRNVLVISR